MTYSCHPCVWPKFHHQGRHWPNSHFIPLVTCLVHHICCDLCPFWVQAMTTGSPTLPQSLVHPIHCHLFLNYCSSSLFLATHWNVSYIIAGMILLKYKSNHITPVVSHHAYNKIWILCDDLVPSNLSKHVLHSFFAQFILHLWLSCCSSKTLSSLCRWAFTPDVPSLRILFPRILHDRPL